MSVQVETSQDRLTQVRTDQIYVGNGKSSWNRSSQVGTGQVKSQQINKDWSSKDRLS